jgi:[acyl-carrier-protein] S-malonyltransferase
MAAVIGLANEEVQSICNEAAENEILTPANYNSVGQIVVAGHIGAIQRFLLLAKQAGAKLVTQLPVSVPSHCPLMHSATKKLAIELEKIQFRTPLIPIINNVNVSIYDDPKDISLGLTNQLDHPVRWVETIQHLISNGIDAMLECGPGKVLSGLIKRIDNQVVTISINDPETLQQALNLKKEILV